MEAFIVKNEIIKLGIKPLQASTLSSWIAECPLGTTKSECAFNIESLCLTVVEICLNTLKLETSRKTYIKRRSIHGTRKSQEYAVRRWSRAGHVGERRRIIRDEATHAAATNEGA